MLNNFSIYNTRNKLKGFLFFSAIILLSAILMKIAVVNSMLLVLIIGSLLSIWLAYTRPFLTITLLLLLGQIIQYELLSIIKEFNFLKIGSLNFRFSDPIIFGIIVVVLLKLFSNDITFKRILWGKGKYFTLFLIYILFETIRNLNIYGSYALGEFRTYYQGFLIIPYIAINTKLPAEREKYLKLFIFLSISQIILALFKGAVIQGFSLNAYDKWLSATGSLGLLYGLFGFFIYNNYKKIKLSKITFFIIIITGMLIVIIASNRSVWLAGAVGFLMLIFLKELKLREQFIFSVLGIIVLFITIQLFLSEGYNFSNFIDNRFLAFTNFKADNTSLWRYYAWTSLLESASKKIFLGYGLGNNFGFYVPEFNGILGNSPHNFYLAMLYELGSMGLLLIALFFSTFFYYLSKLRNLSKTDYAIQAITNVVIVSLLSYWLAYSTEKDLFTWSYLGLGFSLIINNLKLM